MRVSISDEATESLLETILQRTVADLASSNEWDEDSLKALGGLLTTTTTPSQESLMAILHRHDPREEP